MIKTTSVQRSHLYYDLHLQQSVDSLYSVPPLLLQIRVASLASARRPITEKDPLFSVKVNVLGIDLGHISISVFWFTVDKKKIRSLKILDTLRKYKRSNSTENTMEVENINREKKQTKDNN